jgi:hypothetical protein
MSRELRWAAAGPALLVALTSIGCDPCAGVASCTPGPRISLEGSLVDDASGKAIVGARIDAIRVGGVELERDSVATTTNASGYFRISIDARTEGEAALDLVITPPAGYPDPKLRVVDLRFPTTDVRGDGQVLGLWTTKPHFSYLAQLYYRSNSTTPVANVRVEFRRTGGVELTGGDVYTASADAAGQVVLFDNAVRPAGPVGEVVGDLTVYAGSGFPPTVIRGIRLRAIPRYRPALSVFRAGVGPHLPYYGVVNLAGFPAPDVEVEARRTAGILAEPSPLIMRTNRDGNFYLHDFQPRELGELVVDLTFRPPPPWRSFTHTGLRISTVEEDSFGRLVGTWDLQEFANPNLTLGGALSVRSR